MEFWTLLSTIAAGQVVFIAIVGGTLHYLSERTVK